MTKARFINNIRSTVQTDLEAGFDMFADADYLADYVYPTCDTIESRLTDALATFPDALTRDQLDVARDRAISIIGFVIA